MAGRRFSLTAGVEDATSEDLQQAHLGGGNR